MTWSADGHPQAQRQWLVSQDQCTDDAEGHRAHCAGPRPSANFAMVHLHLTATLPCREVVAIPLVTDEAKESREERKTYNTNDLRLSAKSRPASERLPAGISVKSGFEIAIL